MRFFCTDYETEDESKFKYLLLSSWQVSLSVGPVSSVCHVSLKKMVFNVYLFLRQRETEHEWGRVRERETQNPKQTPGSELSAQSPKQGSNSRTARS